MIQIQIKELMAAKQQEWSKSITLTEVSHETGISRMTLHRALKNHQYKLSTDSIDRLCCFFKYDLIDLLKYTPDKEAA